VRQQGSRAASRTSSIFLIRIMIASTNTWQPGDLGVLRGVVDGFSEEARTRSFASLTLVRFAFVKTANFVIKASSDRGVIYR